MLMLVKTAVLDGKRIAYTDETIFMVQVGKNKGSYVTRNTFKGNLSQAVLYYNAINIGYGYKKRLISDFLKPRVLARAFS